VAFAPPRAVPAPPEWAVAGTGEHRRNLVTSIYLEPDLLERHVRHLESKYRLAEQTEARAELYRVEDAEVVLIGYGFVGRVLKAVVEAARAQGIALGLIRPITLYPFPAAAIREAARGARAFAVVEMSTGQLVDDVRLTLNGRVPVEFLSRTGGNVPTAEEVLAFVQRTFAFEEALVHA